MTPGAEGGEAGRRRSVLVTGTRKGLGRALAEHFLAEGWFVGGCSRGETDLVHERYRHHAADVADEGAVVAMVRAFVREAGGLDALVNNAGIASMNAALLTPSRTVRDILGTNFLGTFHACREAAKAMVPRKAGRIVNLSTVAVPLRLEGESAYAASKAAVESLTEVLSRELGPHGITVNAVGPTPVQTDLVRGVPAAVMERLLARQALPRWGTPADVINAVDFFLRPESGFVTGQVLYLGGVHR